MSRPWCSRAGDRDRWLARRLGVSAGKDDRLYRATHKALAAQRRRDRLRARRRHRRPSCAAIIGSEIIVRLPRRSVAPGREVRSRVAIGARLRANSGDQQRHARRRHARAAHQVLARIARLSASKGPRPAGGGEAPAVTAVAGAPGLFLLPSGLPHGRRVVATTPSWLRHRRDSMVSMLCATLPQSGRFPLGGSGATGGCTRSHRHQFLKLSAVVTLFSDRES